MSPLQPAPGRVVHGGRRNVAAAKERPRPRCGLRFNRQPDRRPVCPSVSTRSIFISTRRAINLRHGALLRRLQAGRPRRTDRSASGGPDRPGSWACDGPMRTGRPAARAAGDASQRARSSGRTDGGTDRQKTSEADESEFVVNHAARRALASCIRAHHAHRQQSGIHCCSAGGRAVASLLAAAADCKTSLPSDCNMSACNNDRCRTITHRMTLFTVTVHDVRTVEVCIGMAIMAGPFMEMGNGVGLI